MTRLLPHLGLVSYKCSCEFIHSFTHLLLKAHKKCVCTIMREQWKISIYTWITHTHTHTHTQTFNSPLSGTIWVSRYQKGKPIWILLKQETVSGSSISWVICKSAPHSREITTQHPTSQFFTGWVPFLPPNQQRQSTEGHLHINKNNKKTKANFKTQNTLGMP